MTWQFVLFTFNAFVAMLLIAGDIDEGVGLTTYFCDIYFCLLNGCPS
jgi:hypothetical protein